MIVWKLIRLDLGCGKDVPSEKAGDGLTVHCASVPRYLHRSTIQIPTPYVELFTASRNEKFHILITPRY